MEIQAIAFDMDDTLLRDDRTISLYTVDVLNRAVAKGIRIIPATGRVRGSILDYLRQIGCADCYITGNGSQLWSGDHKLLHEQLLDPRDMADIFSFGNTMGVYMHTYYDDCFYYNIEGTFSRMYAEAARIEGRHAPDLAGFAVRPAQKILMMADADTIARMLVLAQQQLGHRVQVTCSKPTFLEFNSSLSSKGFALQTAARIRGFSLRRSAAFGDSLNDMSMLTIVGHGVAMANARPDVLQMIPTHALSNEQDGVARFIEEHFL